MVTFEGVKEFKQNFIFGFLSVDDVGAHFGVVLLADVIDLEKTRAINVHDLEGFQADALSEIVHFPANSSQEFIIADLSISCSVEDFKQSFRVLGFNANTEVVHSLFEFFHIQKSTSIVVRDFELSADSLNTTGTTGSKFCTESFNELGIRVVHWWKTTSLITLTVLRRI